jgi:hypothetical protein
MCRCRYRFFCYILCFCDSVKKYGIILAFSPGFWGESERQNSCYWLQKKSYDIYYVTRFFLLVSLILKNL